MEAVNSSETLLHNFTVSFQKTVNTNFAGVYSVINLEESPALVLGIFYFFVQKVRAAPSSEVLSFP
jgi:hypothetical protein